VRLRYYCVCNFFAPSDIDIEVVKQVSVKYSGYSMFSCSKGEPKMPIEENNESTSSKSNPEDAAERPSSTYPKEEGTRLGSKEDSREAGEHEGEGPPEPRDNLRDGI